MNNLRKARFEKRISQIQLFQKTGIWPSRISHLENDHVKATRTEKKKLATALNNEYKYRYKTNKDHESFVVIQKLTCPTLPDIGLTEFAQAMPDKYKVPNNAVLAYRNYYIGMKKSFATWTRRRMPKWFDGGVAIAV